MKIAIIGAAELGKLAAHHALTDSGVAVAGYYDDAAAGSTHFGLPVLGPLDEILADHSSGVFDHLFIAVGYKHTGLRKALYDRFSGKIPFANIIHSSSYVDPSCKVGEGVFILPNCTLDSGVTLGNNVLLNTGVVIAHHTTIGSHSFIAPAVHFAGLINVGESCFIGIGSTIINEIQIADNSTIGAGSLVLKNTSENSLSFGSPAKQVKK